MNTFMLVMTILSTDGTSEDITLGSGLSWVVCVEMAYVTAGINENTIVYCELEGVYYD
jgi:hypothetical protein